MTNDDKGFTKKEIVKTIADECGLTQLKTKEIVQKTFEAIIDALVTSEHKRIELRNFGVFEVKERAARKARNPRSGDRVDVPKKNVVTFKPGKEMEERVLNVKVPDRKGKRKDSEDAESPSLPSPSQNSEPRPHAAHADSGRPVDQPMS